MLDDSAIILYVIRLGVKKNQQCKNLQYSRNTSDSNVANHVHHFLKLFLKDDNLLGDVNKHVIKCEGVCSILYHF